MPVLTAHVVVDDSCFHDGREPSCRPAPRWACDRNGITISDTAARTIPTVEGEASATPSRARRDSTVT
jgi:hypothetical protein